MLEETDFEFIKEGTTDAITINKEIAHQLKRIADVLEFRTERDYLEDEEGEEPSIHT